MNEIKDSLKVEVLEELKGLKGINLGTDDYKCTVEGISKLVDRCLEIEKIEADSIDKEARRNLEKDKFEAEVKDKESKLEFEKEKFEADKSDKNARLELDRDKLDADSNDKEARLQLDRDKLEADNESKEKEIEVRIEENSNNKLDNLVRNGLTAVGIIVPTVVTIWGTIKTFKFEETGTITTMIGRGFISKIIPKK